MLFNAKMEEMRQSLDEYVGYKLNTPNIQNKQKEAVERLMFLSKAQFEDLVEDIYEEIHIRMGFADSGKPDTMFQNARNISRRKLKKLDNEKFSNLVLDVLLVLNHRLPSRLEKSGIEHLLEDLEEILNSMKHSKTDEEIVLEELDSNTSFFKRTETFIEYIRRIFLKNTIDQRVLDAYSRIFANFKETSIHDQFIDIFDKEDFMKVTDKYFKEKKNLVYDYHRRNVCMLLKNKPGQYEKILCMELSKIFEILLQCKGIIDAEKFGHTFTYEIKELMDRLESFVTSMKANDNEQILTESGIRLLESSNNFLVKLKDHEFEGNDMLITTYITQQKNIEAALKEKQVGYYLFNAVIEFAYFLKELFVILKIEV